MLAAGGGGIGLAALNFSRMNLFIQIIWFAYLSKDYSQDCSHDLGISSEKSQFELPLSGLTKCRCQIRSELPLFVRVRSIFLPIKVGYGENFSLPSWAALIFGKGK